MFPQRSFSASFGSWLVCRPVSQSVLSAFTSPRGGRARTGRVVCAMLSLRPTPGARVGAAAVCLVESGRRCPERCLARFAYGCGRALWSDRARSLSAQPTDSGLFGCRPCARHAFVSRDGTVFPFGLRPTSFSTSVSPQDILITLMSFPKAFLALCLDLPTFPSSVHILHTAI